MNLKDGIKTALYEIHNRWQAGFVVEGTSRQRVPDQEWYDCGWKPEIVHEFIREINTELSISNGDKKHSPYVGAYGRGQATLEKIRYYHPKRTGNIVRDVHPAGMWYLEKMPKRSTHAVFWDADSTKWEFQHSLTLPPTD